MEKITFKEKWLNKSAINYNNVSINKLDIERIIGVYAENDTQVLLAIEAGKLLFLDALTFNECKKPLKLGAASKIHYDKQMLIMVNNRPHYFMHGAYCDLVVDLWDAEIIIRNDYPDTDWISDSNRVDEFIIQDEFLYILRYTGVLEMWNILQRQIVASYTLNNDIKISRPKLQKFDNILQLQTHKENEVIYNHDASTLNLINQVSIVPHKDASGVEIQGRRVPFKLNGKWVIVVDQDKNSPQRGSYYLYDALTYEMIREIPADTDPQNKGGRPIVHYNKAGDPLLIVSAFGTAHRGYVYNLNHIDKGFQYFKDDSIILGKEYFGEETRYITPIKPEYAHLYKDCSYLSQPVILCDFNGETVVVEYRSGKMWSLETLEPVKDTKPAKYIGDNQDLWDLYPVKLPNGQTGIITNWGELWNPLGAANDSISTSFIQPTTINQQAVFVAYTAAGFLVLYNTATGKEIGKSEKLNHDVIEMLLVQVNDQQEIVVCSEKGIVERYTLPKLEKTGTSYELKALHPNEDDNGDDDDLSLGNIYVVPFENKLQLVANIGSSQISTWDFLTGEPIHHPLAIAYKDEDEDEEQFLDGGYADFECKLFYQDNQPFFGINVADTENAFLWDLNKQAYVGALDLYDKKLEKYFDEDESTYNVFDFEPVQINGQDLLLTLSTTGVFAFFDPKTLLRVGAIKSTEIEYEKFQVVSHKGQQLIVGKSYLTLYIFDLLTLKIVKKFTFDQNITAYTISNGHIIIASGEQVVAYEMK